MIMIYLLGGLALNILSIVLFQFESTRDLNRYVLRYLFRLLPNYAICDTIFYLSFRQFTRQSQVPAQLQSTCRNLCNRDLFAHNNSKWNKQNNNKDIGSCLTSYPHINVCTRIVLLQPLEFAYLPLPSLFVPHSFFSLALSVGHGD